MFFVYGFEAVSRRATYIDGKSLGFALEKELSKSFLELALLCKAVVCCASRLVLDAAL